MKSVNISSYPTAEDCLFGAVRLTKRVHTALYKIQDMILDFMEKDFFQLVMKLVEM